MKPAESVRLLQGKSFGVLQPLFESAAALIGSESPGARAQARLRARMESSALPFIPQIFSTALLRAVEGGSSVSMPFDYIASPGPRSVTHIDDIYRAQNLDWHWEPLSDSMKAIQRLKWAKTFVSNMRERTAESRRISAEKEAELREMLQAPLEHDSMEFEDIRSVIFRADLQLKLAGERISKVMNFSKSKFGDFLAQEKNEMEEWTQAWDALEDGHAWEGLNKKRYIERDLIRFTEAFNAALLKLSGTCTYVSGARAAAESAAAIFRKHLAEQQDADAQFAMLRKQNNELRKLARETFRAASSTLSLPRRVWRPSRQTLLQTVPYHLTFVRDPLLRTKRECRAAWRGLHKRLMTLRPVRCFTTDNRFKNPSPCLRAIVEVFSDPVTGLLIIHVGHQPGHNPSTASRKDLETPMEENAFFLDIDQAKADFSIMNANSIDTELVLRKCDVDYILSRHPLWPDYVQPQLPDVANWHKEITHKKSQDGMTGKLEDEMSGFATSPGRFPSPFSPSGSHDDVTPFLEDSIDVPDRQHLSMSYAAHYHKQVQASSTMLYQRPPLRSYKPKPDASLLPSQYPRRIDFVKCHIQPGRGRIGHPDESLTYKSRRDLNEAEENAKVDALLSYLRLHPHSKRPCLGLLHFRRRMDHAHKQISSSVWMRDLTLSRPSSWCNSMMENLMFDTCLQPIRCSMQASLMHVELRLVNRQRECGLVIPMENIFEAMAEHRPLLLASFLGEIIANKLSVDSMQFILDRVDMSLPGEGFEIPFKKGPKIGTELTRWRAAFPLEFPVATFLRHDDELFRGPPYCCHRFIAGKYFHCRFTFSASDDIKIVLSSPTDGNFWGHKYEGTPVVVKLTRDELRVFVAKICFTDFVPRNLRNSISILREEHRETLFSLLLDTVMLEPHVFEGKYPTLQFPELFPDSIAFRRRQRRSSPLALTIENATKALTEIHARQHAWPSGPQTSQDSNSVTSFNDGSAHAHATGKGLFEDDDDEERSVMSGISLQSSSSSGDNDDGSPLMIQQVSKFYAQFNEWAQRSQGCIAPLKDSLMRAAFTSVQAVITRPDWTLRLQKDDQKNKLVEVHRGVWVTLDLDRYYGRKIDGEVVARKKHEMGSRHGCEGRTLRDDNGSGSGDVLHLDSYWFVRIVTDVPKDTFFIDLRPSSLYNRTVQTFLAGQEREKMGEEDEFSRSLQFYEKSLGLRLRLGKSLDHRNQRLKHLLEQKRWLMKCATAAKQLIADFRSKAFKTLRKWLRDTCSRISAFACIWQTSILLRAFSGISCWTNGVIAETIEVDAHNPSPSALTHVLSGSWHLPWSLMNDIIFSIPQRVNHNVRIEHGDVKLSPFVERNDDDDDDDDELKDISSSSATSPLVAQWKESWRNVQVPPKISTLPADVVDETDWMIRLAETLATFDSFPVQKALLSSSSMGDDGKAFVATLAPIKATSKKVPLVLTEEEKSEFNSKLGRGRGLSVLELREREMRFESTATLPRYSSLQFVPEQSKFREVRQFITVVDVHIFQCRNTIFVPIIF